MSHNDANNDGLPDDWVEDISRKLNLPTGGADDPVNDEGDTLRDLYRALEPSRDAEPTENQSDVLARYFAALNANNPDWPYMNDDNDGLLNRLELELGTRPDRSDTDNDNQTDAEDADPLDPVVDWRKSPPPAWTVFPLAQFVSPTTHKFHDAYHSGTLLFEELDEQGVGTQAYILLANDFQTVRRIDPPAGDTGFGPAPVSHVLHGDQFLGQEKIQENGEILTKLAYYHPLTDQLSRLGDGSPPETIWDATNTHVSGAWWYRTTEFPALVFESTENAVSLTTIGPHQANPGIIYHTFTPDGFTDRHVTQSDRFTSSFTSASLTQTDPTGPTLTRHIVPTAGKVHVATDSEPFRAAGISYPSAVEDHNQLAATVQGWVIDGTSNQVWANRRWHLIAPMLARNLDDTPPDQFQIRKILDTGMMIVEMRYPDEPAPSFHILMPVSVEELSPPLINERDQTIPGTQFAAALPASNAMVERDPHNQIPDASTQRIAWREMRISVGKAFAGRSVTWSMTPLFTPHHVVTAGTATTPEVTAPEGNPRFRGTWEHAANPRHRDAF